MTKRKATLESVARLILNRPPADDNERGGSFGRGNSAEAVRARVTLQRVPWLSRTIPFWDLPVAEWNGELEDRRRETSARRSRKTAVSAPAEAAT